LVLINPPYAEAMNVENTSQGGAKAGLKSGVSKTRISAGMERPRYRSRTLSNRPQAQRMYEESGGLTGQSVA